MTQPTPLPFKPMFVLCCVLLTESLSITFLFPFVPFMVSSFPGVNEENLGYKVGMVASAFLFAQFVSSFWWGHLSDRLGRRPILLSGLFANISCTILFGFTKSVWTAVAVRSLCGLLNGNVGVAKCYMADITDETNQARGFSTMSLMWGFGMMFGPLLGGVLANPVERFPNIPFASFFEAYPYVLACIAVASVSGMGFAVGVFHLPETKDLKRKDSNKDSVEMSDLEKGEVDSMEEPESSLYDYNESSDFGGESTVNDDEPDDDDDGDDSSTSYEEEDESDTAPMQVNAMARSMKRGGDSSSSSSKKSKPKKESNKTIMKRHGSGPRKPSLHDVFNRNTLTTTMCYCFLKMCTIMADEVFPVWARTEISVGGLNLEPASISIPLAVGGVALMLFQLFGYYRLDNRFGSLFLFKVGAISAALLIAYIPFMQFVYLRAPTWAFWMEMGVLYIVRSVMLSIAFTSVSLLINNSSLPSTIGLVNGFAQSCSSLFSALAPLIASSTFTFFSHAGIGFPLDYHFIFIMTAVIMALTSIPIFFLPKSAGMRRKEIAFIEH